MNQTTLEIKTSGRGMISLTDMAANLVLKSKITTGLCHFFLHHTSASIVICENADPSVQTDMEAFMSRLVPDGDSLFQHTAEGEDDMPSHVRSILTQNSLTIPITAGQLALGRWQGIYLWEHRLKPHHRKLTVTLDGQ